MKKILFILGTRPDAIKCAPLIIELKKTKTFSVKVCSTGQHKEMLKPVFDFFEIDVDFDLKIMTKNQSLITSISQTILGLEKIKDKFLPDFVIVQGDANPAIGGSLFAFYNKIPIIHLEAGLRSGDMNSPYPEEGNRIVVSHLANFHLAPTRLAANNLKKENIKKNIFIVGNTVIDSLFIAKNKINKFRPSRDLKKINFDKKIILITGHRRENFGKPIEEILKAIKELAIKYSDIEFVYPVHLNPNVKNPVEKILSKQDNIHLINPLDYPSLVYLMNKSYLVITDSGGIQEEAPSLGKPIVVTRNTTERSEGVVAGTAILVGTNPKKLKSAVEKLIKNKEFYKKMSKIKSPYGDGKSSKKIKTILLRLIK